MASVVTRIAPSPTGYMHVGTARTALFNWLYARGRGGKFLLRVEDTDRTRSTPEATAAILRGMDWLGLDYDGEAFSQYARRDRHKDVAETLLAKGHAYKCFSTQDDIAAFRETAKAEGASTLFQSPWRDADPATYPEAPFVIRLKTPQSGVTVIQDEVQGDVRFQNALLDDMILLRSDGTPVYMLAVVVDDYDMGVTHVIRGDDHLANTPRQSMIYTAMGWDLPVYAHIPLIHGPDGKKLSKRHGALGVEDYQAMGYPAAGVRNYLTRLGWSHGDDEFFTTKQALEWFGTKGIGKGAARFDFKKLENICGQHMAVADDAALLQEIDAFLALTGQPAFTSSQSHDMLRALYCLKDRAKTFPELLDKAKFILKSRPLEPDARAEKALDSVSLGILAELTPHLQNARWSREDLESVLGRQAEARGLKLGKLAGPLRAALSASAASPSAFDMMLIIGREETIARIQDVSG